MTITCIHQVALESRMGTSDKVYIIQVQEDLSGSVPSYYTYGFSGRRGASLKKQAPVYHGANRASAIAEANKLEAGKRSGSSRYTTMPLAAGVAPSGMPAGTPVPGGASVTTPATGGVAATTTPLFSHVLMLAKDANELSLAEILVSKDWAEQRKYDGTRCAISLRRSAIVAYNRKGVQTSLSTVVEAELKKLLTQPDFNNDRETILDGELMGDVFVAFDLLTVRDVDMKDLPFVERFGSLEALLENYQGLLAETAWSEEEKRELRERAAVEAWEGTMGRHLDAPYVSGRSDKLLKNKQWAMCTCRVLTAHPTKRSVQIALLDEHGNEEACGNVTVPVNHNMPEADDLVEVRYLYAHDGGSLYQPVYHGLREDKDEADLRSSVRSAPPEKSGGSAATVASPAATSAATAAAATASVLRLTPAPSKALSALLSVADEIIVDI